jgi:hypothetical protein
VVIILCFRLSWCADSEAFGSHAVSGELGGLMKMSYGNELWQCAIEISGRLGPSIAATSCSPASQGRARPAGAFCFLWGRRAGATGQAVGHG